MLVFEGPDGSGKTTLIQRFQEQYPDIPIAPRVVSKDTEMMLDLQKWVDDNLDHGFQRIIFDRYRLISETIYGPILRNKAQPGFDKLSWLCPRMKRFYELKPIIIYCLPPLETVVENVLDDRENTVIAPRIRALYSAYAARASLDYTHSAAEVHVWDYINSIRINDRPVWFPQVADQLRERTAA